MNSLARSHQLKTQQNRQASTLAEALSGLDVVARARTHSLTLGTGSIKGNGCRARSCGPPGFPAAAANFGHASTDFMEAHHRGHLSAGFRGRRSI